MRRAFSLLIAVVVIVGAFYFIVTKTPTAVSTIAPQQAATSTAQQKHALPLVPASISFTTGKTITLQIPQRYSISIAAQGFHAVRFMSWSPDHRLFVGEMTNASDNTTGRVLILDHFDPQSGTFADTHVYVDSLRNPNSVAFYTDAEQREWIYVALTDKLVRYPYQAGDNTPSAAPQIIATFPDFGPPPSAGGWHLTRTLLFRGDTLFVSVGSGCNSCEENVTRADILAMNPDGSGSRIYASGLRNAVGITYAEGALFATANEADHLGNDRPNDLVYKIEESANYGWPYCYQFGNAVYADTTQTWHRPYDCAKVPLAWAVLPPHSAPLGITYADGSFADPQLRDSFLVAMHGSGKPSIGTGYAVVAVRQGIEPLPIINGFLQNRSRVGRPVDVLLSDDHSFFVTDDMNGAIYYIAYHP